MGGTSKDPGQDQGPQPPEAPCAQGTRRAPYREEPSDDQAPVILDLAPSGVGADQARAPTRTAHLEEQHPWTCR